MAARSVCVVLVWLAASSGAALANGRDDLAAAIREADRHAAVTLFTRALSSGELSPPDTAQAHYGRGTTYNDLGDYAHALEDFNKAFEIEPRSAVVLNNRGIAYRHLQQLDQAIADFDAAIRLDPKYAAAYSNRGLAYMDAEDPGRALQDFTDALQLDSNQAAIYINRGNAYDELGQADKALNDYAAAIRIDPDEPNAYRQRALLYFHRHDWARETADLNILLRLAPNDVNALADRAHALYFSGDFAGAVRDLQKWGAITSEPEAAYYRGLANFALGRFADAAADFESVVRATPGEPAPLAWAHLSNARAGKRFDLAGAAAGVNDRVWPYPAVALFLGKMDDDAVRATVAASDAEPARKCDVAFFIGERQLLAGGAAAARAAFEWIVRTCDPIFYSYVSAKAELSHLPK